MCERINRGIIEISRKRATHEREKKPVKTDKKWHAKATIANKQTKCTKVLDNQSRKKWIDRCQISQQEKKKCRMLMQKANSQCMSSQTNLINVQANWVAKIPYSRAKCVQPVISHSQDLINTVRFLICYNANETTSKFVITSNGVNAWNPFSWNSFGHMHRLLFVMHCGRARVSALMALSNFMDCKQIILEKWPHKEGKKNTLGWHTQLQKRCKTTKVANEKLNALAIVIRLKHIQNGKCRCFNALSKTYCTILCERHILSLQWRHFQATFIPRTICR